ncbi:hypothetical protein ASPFODRAFT_458850 [Aspergillus luchuensis CBS 106.47]|uniref:Uncharacterized protein n=1 Tax=Aspergillus luchuensis (strain CBS 106.47) TaxID=1137211 RepID=A0A1M3T140_ASPLC|nr:hypothetical protein ASPFODRAFT_458850 [Aspergillus luchuensis CBS 106.47]
MGRKWQRSRIGKESYFLFVNAYILPCGSANQLSVGLGIAWVDTCTSCVDYLIASQRARCLTSGERNEESPSFIAFRPRRRDSVPDLLENRRHFQGGQRSWQGLGHLHTRHAHHCPVK